MLDWKSVFLLLVPVWWHKQLQCQIFVFFCLVDFSLISKPVQPDVLWDIYEYTDESHIKYLSQDPSGAQRLQEALRFVAAERQNSVCPPFFNLFMYALFLLEDHSSFSHIPPANAEWIQTVLMMGHKTYYQYMENSYFPHVDDAQVGRICWSFDYYFKW